MSKKTSKDVMEALHRLLAEALTKAIEDGETVVTKEGVETISVRPGTLAVAAKFLKDNGIFGVDLDDETMARLAQEVGDLVEDDEQLASMLN